MTLDTTRIFDVKDGSYKTISVENLVRILASLPPGCRVCTNLVHNLAVMDSENVQISYIDVGSEEFEDWRAEP